MGYGRHYCLISKLFSQKALKWLRVVRPRPLEHEILHLEVQALTVTGRLAYRKRASRKDNGCHLMGYSAGR